MSTPPMVTFEIRRGEPPEPLAPKPLVAQGVVLGNGLVAIGWLRRKPTASIHSSLGEAIMDCASEFPGTVFIRTCKLDADRINGLLLNGIQDEFEGVCPRKDSNEGYLWSQREQLLDVLSREQIFPKGGP